MFIDSLYIGVVHLVFSLSENPFIRSDLRSKLVCASLLKGKCYRFRILRGFTPDVHLYYSCAPRIQYFSFEVKI